MGAAQVTRLLKADQLGRVERVEAREAPFVRRVACGGRIPGSGFLARRLMARERRALSALDGLAGVPGVIDDEELASCASPGRGSPRRREVLVRSWIAGRALHETETLPLDFFDRLDDLVRALHARGVCHNDLHKEQNILVGDDGWPHLVDFQLASVHARRSRFFESRARDDLRHVEKHRRRYTRFDRGPAGAVVSRGSGFGVKRSWVALVWRRAVKPVYIAFTRGLLRTRDGEARRPSSGPWPRWVDAIGGMDRRA